jgi:hypothetical protein
MLPSRLFYFVTSHVEQLHPTRANILQRFNRVLRADRNDLRPVDLFVRKVIVLLARFEIGGILEGGVVPVEVLQPTVESGIVVTNCR